MQRAVVIGVLLLGGCLPGGQPDPAEAPASPAPVLPPREHGAWRPPGGPAPARRPAGREPCHERDPLRRAFFGDLHVHTSLSLDAALRGGFQTPDDAYRFARGEAIGLSPRDDSGRPLRQARLKRPLDFAAVTDHAEWIGETSLCRRRGSPAYDTPECRALRGEAPSENGLRDLMPIFQGGARSDPRVCGPEGAWCRAELKSAWVLTQEAAERHYDRSRRCRFTSFHAWEYTRSPDLTKVHRNVILRNEIVPELPISWTEEPEPEGLWQALENRCNDTGTGCEALTIPHNPNLSNGQMFEIRYRDQPLEEQRERARMQARLEPLVEMVQSKGESECRRGMWQVVGGEDELCDFEKIRSVAGGKRPEDCREGSGSGAMTKQGCQSRLDFVRYALIEGLREAGRIGVNPYRFGLIGSTDTHNATPGATDEADYPGHNADVDASLSQRLETDAYAPHPLRNPGGLVGLWAEDNSRDALFDAMKRREAFATSGVRIAPRFFAGWDLPADLCERPGLVERAYADGVPMGGVLPAHPASAGAPVFVASALRDPGTTDHPGGLLQRIQIIKGWVGDDGRFHERIVEVAGDPDSEADVDRDTCRPRGPGATSLCGMWTDPEFDSARPVVYYARVVENPSCRWNALQCLARPEADRPAACSDDALPWKIQERAWTSPIWYEPGGPSAGFPGAAASAVGGLTRGTPPG